MSRSNFSQLLIVFLVGFLGNILGQYTEKVYLEKEVAGVMRDCLKFKFTIETCAFIMGVKGDGPAQL